MRGERLRALSASAVEGLPCEKKSEWVAPDRCASPAATSRKTRLPTCGHWHLANTWASSEQALPEPPDAGLTLLLPPLLP